MSAEGVLAALALLVTPCSHPSISDRYDLEIRLAVDHYWPVEARPYWCAWKAQLVAESALDPRAVSPAGALGLAQVMPATLAEILTKAGLAAGSPFDAVLSLRAGAYYMSWLRSQWTEPRTERCRLELQQAAYNAGLGNVWPAQRIARERGYAARCWDEIQTALAAVTGRHSRETIDYVARIARIEARMRTHR